MSIIIVICSYWRIVWETKISVAVCSVRAFLVCLWNTLSTTNGGDGGFLFVVSQ